MCQNDINNLNYNWNLIIVIDIFYLLQMFIIVAVYQPQL